MTIPDNLRDDWELFLKKADLDEIYPADILLDLVRDFVEQHRDELTDDEESKPKKVVVKKSPPKKKSFLSKKAKIVKKKEEVDESASSDIGQTPKFRLLELIRELDIGDGISPEELVEKASSADIPNPRLQMNKMIRRGILYIHLGKVHLP